MDLVNLFGLSLFLSSSSFAALTPSPSDQIQNLSTVFHQFHIFFFISHLEENVPFLCNFVLDISSKFWNNTYCVGGCHYSGNISIEGDITPDSRNLLFADCVKCNRNKSLTVKNSTVKAEG